MRMDVDGRTHLSVDERKARGKQARKTSPRSESGKWQPASDRRDPVDIVQQGTKTAIPALVPIRYGRMSASAFTFYRGTASLMAADLAPTPSTGIKAQLSGDAHLSNFGLYGAPDRSLIFDANDFDETLPGPWEWDLKRLVASFVLAARENGWDDATQRDVTVAAAAAYRKQMRELAKMDNLSVWYLRIEVEKVVASLPKDQRKPGQKVVKKARGKDSERAVKKLSRVVDGRRQIVNQPPLVVPLRNYFSDRDTDEMRQVIEKLWTQYRESLPNDRKHLADSYTLVDMALKVVGVGSVGARNMIALLQGHDDDDLLFLQIKEAGKSALTEFGGLPWTGDPGQRVVNGQRLMQAASDILLGWSTTDHFHFYFRQLWDMKGSADVAEMNPGALSNYANACGRTLARAHARSGDRIAIAGYLGKGDVFDQAMADFAVVYADQAESDYAEFMSAAASGRITLDTSANK
jgi:uncharacterized protein (DUF2252 family)